jgi:hypothetical protein
VGLRVGAERLVGGRVEGIALDGAALAGAAADAPLGGEPELVEHLLVAQGIGEGAEVCL